MVEDLDLRVFDQLVRGSGRVCFDVFAGESAPVLARYVAAGEPDPRLQEMVVRAVRIGARGLAEALEMREHLAAAYAALADRVDVVITPATTAPAPDGLDGTGCRRLPATSSLLGVPALSAPWLRVEEMPQGVQLLGFAGRDEELLAAARLLQSTIRPTLPTNAPAATQES